MLTTNDHQYASRPDGSKTNVRRQCRCRPPAPLSASRRSPERVILPNRPCSSLRRRRRVSRDVSGCTEAARCTYEPVSVGVCTPLPRRLAWPLRGVIMSSMLLCRDADFCSITLPANSGDERLTRPAMPLSRLPISIVRSDSGLLVVDRPDSAAGPLAAAATVSPAAAAARHAGPAPGPALGPQSAQCRGLPAPSAGASPGAPARPSAQPPTTATSSPSSSSSVASPFSHAVYLTALHVSLACRRCNTLLIPRGSRLRVRT